MNGKRAKAIRRDAALLAITENDARYPSGAFPAWGNTLLSERQKRSFLKKLDRKQKLVLKPREK